MNKHLLADWSAVCYFPVHCSTRVRRMGQKIHMQTGKSVISGILTPLLQWRKPIEAMEKGNGNHPFL